MVSYVYKLTHIPQVNVVALINVDTFVTKNDSIMRLVATYTLIMVYRSKHNKSVTKLNHCYGIFKEVDS